MGNSTSMPSRYAVYANHARRPRCIAPSQPPAAGRRRRRRPRSPPSQGGRDHLPLALIAPISGRELSRWPVCGAWCANGRSPPGGGPSGPAASPRGGGARRASRLPTGGLAAAWPRAPASRNGWTGSRTPHPPRRRPQWSPRRLRATRMRPPAARSAPAAAGSFFPCDGRLPPGVRWR